MKCYVVRPVAGLDSREVLGEVLAEFQTLAEAIAYVVDHQGAYPNGLGIDVWNEPDASGY